MTPATRTQPTIPAVRVGGRWVATLPDGTRIESPSEGEVRERVKAIAQAAVRFEAAR